MKFSSEVQKYTICAHALMEIKCEAFKVFTTRKRWNRLFIIKREKISIDRLSVIALR